MIVAVATELNQRLAECNWLDSAPFDTVSLILRFGDAKPDTQIGAINTSHSELPVARELSMDACIERARAGTLLAYFRVETIVALTDVSRRYNLSLDLCDHD
ncbi:Imm39 family immunity protein [Crateriforma spongiae]|uniref:Imm39 family immunity protein n=1 Tax=Crateriforma spongiae TaxID=2724528 RepID=UPI0039AFE84C